MKSRLLGFELYFDDLRAARDFYREVVGLTLSEDQPGHHARFDSGAAFLCLERKGGESYPSLDKAVVFLEVDDLSASMAELGERILESGPASAARPSWAVLHDPEGHSIVLIQRK